MGSCFEASAQVVDSAYLPQNVGPNVNGQYDDILPVISPDGLALYFCRSHSPENIGGGRQDIWLSEFQADGKWGLAKNVGIPLNNRDNNYLCSITPDGNTLIIGDGYSAATNRQRSIASFRVVSATLANLNSLTASTLLNTGGIDLRSEGEIPTNHKQNLSLLFKNSNDPTHLLTYKDAAGHSFSS